ncbi:MAG: UvrD-helicase domain-containing protein, partial [Salinivirgaceae bacterium]|nr:UvrD-helicase domain-containing protein [Salinivirgaceae bacterium]
MEKKSLTIYKASAGSGKTFKLTQHYLSLALCSEKNYSQILAITFTRKATAEMRKRIIDELEFLSKEPSKSDHCETLCAELKIDVQEIQSRARKLLSAIIHDYSNFSVTTIDQFFQRIIRSLTRELGIAGNYRIEMDEGKVLTQAVESMFESAMTVEPLFRLLSDYIQNQIVTEGKSHMIQRGIVEFVKSMMREDLKDSFIKLGNDNFDDQIVAIQKEMSQKTRQFEFECSQRLQALEQCMANHGMERSQLSQKSCIVTKFYKMLFSREFGEKVLNEIFQSEFADIDDPLSIFPKTLFKEVSKALAEQVAYDVLSLFQNDYQFFISGFPTYFLSKNAKSRLWHVRFFGYTWSEMNKIKSDENIFIIGDAPVLLSQIAEKTDTPFIFERIANHYNHFMIDEFQDTSNLQWKNLGPFLENSMSQFLPDQQKSEVNNLIVGDVKQAIYRFRNGDWSLLDERVPAQLADLGIQEEILNTNWRSEKVIVDFNNQVFDILPKIIPLNHFARMPASFRERLKNIYLNQQQYINPKKIDALEKGSVRIEAIPPEEYRADTIDRVCSQVFTYLNGGAAMGHIAILVRKSEDGREIAQQLLSYNPQETGYKLQIAMSDVLSIDKSIAVQAIVQVLYYLSNPDEEFYLWLAAYQICSLNGKDLGFFFENSIEEQLPEQFFTDLEAIKKMPIHEVVGYLIALFGLYKSINEVPYLARFQNIVTLYVQNYGSDRHSFLLYWEEDGKGMKMPTPASLDAIQILTIHKSKGLEFEHVIIPFVDWSIVHKGRNDIWITDDSQQENLFLPVPFNKAAEYSTYSNQLHQEYFNLVVDSLNIIYVG